MILCLKIYYTLFWEIIDSKQTERPTVSFDARGKIVISRNLTPLSHQTNGRAKKANKTRFRTK
jgi:hypothetical protein